MENKTGPQTQNQNQIVFSVSKNRVIPIEINADLPVYNPRATGSSVTVYVGLAVKPYASGDYLVALTWQSRTTAPIGAVVRYGYSSGSRKRVYFRLEKFFIVKEGKYELKVKHENREYTLTLTNLMPIDIAEDDLKKAEAEIYNRGWKPSRYDPVRTLYAIWMMKRLHEEEKKEREEAKTEKEEKEKREASIDDVLSKYAFLLDETEEGDAQHEPQQQSAPILEPPATTSTTTSTPPVVSPQVEEQAPSTVQPVEAQKLVSMWFVVFDLPSWSRAVIRRDVEEEHNTIRIQMVLDNKLRSTLETLRRMFYAKLEELAIWSPYGWLAVDEDDVREINDLINEYMKKLEEVKKKHNIDVKMFARTYKAYLELETAYEIVNYLKRSLNEEIQKTAAEIEELKKQELKSEIKRKLVQLEKKQKIAEAKLKAVLEYERRFLQNLLQDSQSA